MGKTLKMVTPLVFFIFLLTLGACSTESFGQLALGGESVLNSKCKDCHGIGGIGGFAPPLDNNLGYSFDNAKQIYDKIRTEMPRNNPGSLSALEYRQVFSYVLVNNGFVSEQDIFKAGNLSDITIP
jgi:mono/diheme cytochrome c family protein